MPHDALVASKRRGEDFGILNYDPALIVRRNWEMDLYGDPDTAWRIKYDTLTAVGWADVVVWMGLHSPEALNLFKLSKVRHPHVKHLMEIDDFLLSSSRSNPQAGEVYRYGGDLAKIGLEQMRHSDGIIVSTPTLAEMYKPYAKKIFVVENVVDLSLWPKPKAEASKNLTIGWIGAGSHDDDLGLLRGVIPHILAKYPNVEFSIVHGCPEFFKHKDDCEFLLNPRDPRYKKMKKCTKCGGLDRVRWTHDFKTIDKYPKWAASFGFDIGIAPLVDINFTRGKSNLRWLEYSAMGRPTIASPLNHFRETIRDGETGIVLKDNSPESWIEAIETLIEDQDLRKAIGKNAREEVVRNWSPAVMAKKYRAVIQEITHAQPHEVGASDAGGSVDKRPIEHKVYSRPEASRNPEMAGTICP